VRLTLALFVLTLPAFSQTNPCVYQYTFPNFQFCLSNYGTVAKLESPIGLNHMGDTPVEGWTALIGTTGTGVLSQWSQITNLSSGPEPATVKHPNGLGRLPVVFEWYEGVSNSTIRETVTAVPAQKIVSIAFTVKPCLGCKVTWWANRVAAKLKVDGIGANHFMQSGMAAMQVNWRGVKLGVSATPGINVCAAVDEAPANPDPNSYEGCRSNVTFDGTGTLYAVSWPAHQGAVITWTYEVF